MKKLLILILLYTLCSVPSASFGWIHIQSFVPPAGGAGIAYVGGNSAAGAYVYPSQSVNYTITAANNLLVLSFWTTRPGVVSDTRSNSWTEAVASAECTYCPSGGVAHLYYAVANAPGATTFTVGDFGDTAIINMSITEYSGIVTSSPLDKTESKVSPTDSGVSAWQTPDTAALSQANELVVGYSYASDGAGVKGDSYTLATTLNGCVTEYKVVASTTAVNADWTAGWTRYACVMATFKGM